MRPAARGTCIGAVFGAMGMAAAVACGAFIAEDERPLAEGGAEDGAAAGDGSVGMSDGMTISPCPTTIIADDFERSPSQVRGAWNGIVEESAALTLDPSAGFDGGTALRANGIGFGPPAGPHHAFLAQELPPGTTIPLCFDVKLKLGQASPGAAQIFGPRVLGYVDTGTLSGGHYQGFHLQVSSNPMRSTLLLVQEAFGLCPFGADACAGHDGLPLVDPMNVGQWYAVSMRTAIGDGGLDAGPPVLVVLVDGRVVLEQPITTGILAMPHRGARIGITSFGEGQLLFDDVRIAK